MLQSLPGFGACGFFLIKAVRARFEMNCFGVQEGPKVTYSKYTGLEIARTSSMPKTFRVATR